MSTKTYISKDKSKRFVFFYRAGSVFSNFHPVEFFAKPLEELTISPEIQKTLKFTCSEQYFMYHKALFAGDAEIAEKILKEENPKEMKMLGRMLGMSEEQLEKWSETSRDVMYHACLEKFSQSEKCRKNLFKTHGMNLAEASPSDKVWGIGLDLKDPKCQDPKLWRGSNWLGLILDKVRDELWSRKEFQTEKEQIEKESLESRAKFLSDNQILL